MSLTYTVNNIEQERNSEMPLIEVKEGKRIKWMRFDDYMIHDYSMSKFCNFKEPVEYIHNTKTDPNYDHAF